MNLQDSELILLFFGLSLRVSTQRYLLVAAHRGGRPAVEQQDWAEQRKLEELSWGAPLHSPHNADLPVGHFILHTLFHTYYQTCPYTGIYHLLQLGSNSTKTNL